MWWDSNPLSIITITINTEENLAVAEACNAFKKSLISAGLIDEGNDIDMSFIKHGSHEYRVNLDWTTDFQK